MENNEQNGAAQEPENYPLDDALIGMIEETRAEGARQQQRLEGALNLFVRQHKLTGAWNLAQNGRELVKQPQPAPAPQQ